MRVRVCVCIDANLHPKVIQQENKAKDHSVERHMEVIVYGLCRLQFLATSLVSGVCRVVCVWGGGKRGAYGGAGRWFAGRGVCVQKRCD